MKLTSKWIYVLLLITGFGTSKAQNINLDSLINDFDRICDCRSLKVVSKESYASCLEKETKNSFFHRTDFLQLSNYWESEDEQKSYQYAKNYFNYGGYFTKGVDSSTLKQELKICISKASYFQEFLEMAINNQQLRDRILQSNTKISNALTQLKPYDQFVRSDKEENLRLMNDINLENSAWKIQIRLDSLNRLFLAAVLDSNWITIDSYGFEANKVAWLIAQHADDDLAFQEKCLKLMLTSYPKDRTASGMYLAYLIDRLSINRNGYQFFGTQFTHTNGEMKPKPIQGEEKVNQRRKQVYLPPLDSYLEDSKEYLENK